MSEIWLTVRVPNRRHLTVLLDGPLVVGRDCDGLVVADQRVSRRHTSFEQIDDKVRVTDLDSSNGTLINGERANGPRLVGSGDRISIGDTDIVIRTAAQANRIGSSGPLLTEIVTPEQDIMKTSIELVADAVGDDALGPQVVGVEDEAGTLTVVFSDIESSTKLALAMGDVKWMDVLRQQHELVEAHVGAHRGRIIKNQGDGYMLCFRSARQALLACIGMQRDLARMNDASDTPDIRVRMGAHTGEVLMQDDGDIFGKHVIVAARVGALAEGARILVSSLVKQIAEPRGDINFGPPHDAELKGIGGVTTVYDVDWASYSAT